MNKTDLHKQDLHELITNTSSESLLTSLIQYLTKNSNLPSPRGNLELAAAFSMIILEINPLTKDQWWAILSNLSAFSPEVAPVNSPKEFLPFCAMVGMGTYTIKWPSDFHKILSIFQQFSEDSRWRVREAVAMGLTHLLSIDEKEIWDNLFTWIQPTKWVQMRAVAAAIAEPDLLESSKYTKKSLKMIQQIITYFIQAEHSDRKAEPFIILKKGLSYAVSVIVATFPTEGFEYLKQIIKTPDSDLRAVLKENFKKTRLIKKYPKQMQELNKLLEE